MKKTQALPKTILLLAKEIVNGTADGEIGYAEAADTVIENWNQFAEVGATVADVERINGFLRWMKSEGFCKNCPMT